MTEDAKESHTPSASGTGPNSAARDGAGTRGAAILEFQRTYQVQERLMAAFTYDHIHLRSPDAEATARWYEEMFGAEIIRSVQSDGRPRLDLNLGGVAVFIAPVPSGQAVPSPPQPPYLGLQPFG